MRLFLLTTLTMVAFAANSVLNRLALADGAIDPVLFGTIRVVSGALMLAAIVMATRGGAQFLAAGRIVSVMALSVYIFGFSLAYVVLDAGLGALILFGMVQITMFAGAIARQDPIPTARWLGAALAFGGLIFLLAPGGGIDGVWHAALMAAAGIGWGIYSLAGRGAADALGATAANFVLAVPVAVVAFALIGAGHMTGLGVALAVLSGAITSGLGYALWYAVLPALGATRGAVAQLTVPPIAMGGGMIFLDETLTWRFALASVLVLGGVALSLRPVTAR